MTSFFAREIATKNSDIAASPQKELFLDAEHDNLVELEPLALMDCEDPHGIELGQSLERLDWVPVDDERLAECRKRVLHHVIEPRALLVSGR